MTAQDGDVTSSRDHSRQFKTGVSRTYEAFGVLEIRSFWSVGNKKLPQLPRARVHKTDKSKIQHALILFASIFTVKILSTSIF